jgi:hypothetical protein
VPPDSDKEQMSPEQWKAYGDQVQIELDRRLGSASHIKSLSELETPAGVEKFYTGFEVLNGLEVQDAFGSLYEVKVTRMPAVRALDFSLPIKAGTQFRAVAGFRVDLLDAREQANKQSVAFREFEIGVATSPDKQKTLFMNTMLTRTEPDFRTRGLGEGLYWMTHTTSKDLGGVNDGDFLIFGVVGHEESKALLAPERVNQKSRVKPVREDLAQQIPITQLIGRTAGKEAKTSIVSVREINLNDLTPADYFQFVVVTRGKPLFPTPSRIGTGSTDAYVEAQWDLLVSAGGTEWTQIIADFGPQGDGLSGIMADEFPELSDAAREVIRVNGMPAAPLSTDLKVNGQETISQWFEIGGNGNPQNWKGIRYPLLADPRTETFLKVATTPEMATTLRDHDLPILRESLRSAGMLASAKDVEMVNITVGTKRMQALKMPLFTRNAVDQLESGKINVEQALKIFEQVTIQNMVLWKKTGVVHFFDARDVMIGGEDRVFTLGFSHSSIFRGVSRVEYDEPVMKLILRSAGIAAGNAGLPWKDADLTEFLRTQKRTDLLPEAGQVAQIALTPIAGAINPDQVLLSRERDVGLAIPGRQLAKSGVLDFLKKSAEGMVYIMAADTLLKAMNPAENPVEKLEISSDQIRLDHYKDDCQKELITQQNLDKLFGSVFYSKTSWANRFKTDYDGSLHPELWEPKWREEKVLLALYPGASPQKLIGIRDQYRQNVFQDLIQNSLIGWKKLAIPDPADPLKIKNFPFNEEIYISATSADQMGKTDNRLIVWTTVPEANNQKRMVTLLEMEQAKKDDAWTMVQQSNESLTIKINKQDRTARLLQFAGNLIIKIDAAGK